MSLSSINTIAYEIYYIVNFFVMLKRFSQYLRKTLELIRSKSRVSTVVLNFALLRPIRKTQTSEEPGRGAPDNDHGPEPITAPPPLWRPNVRSVQWPI